MREDSDDFLISKVVTQDVVALCDIIYQIILIIAIGESGNGCPLDKKAPDASERHEDLLLLKHVEKVHNNYNS